MNSDTAVYKLQTNLVEVTVILPIETLDELCCVYTYHIFFIKPPRGLFLKIFPSPSFMLWLFWLQDFMQILFKWKLTIHIENSIVGGGAY